MDRDAHRRHLAELLAADQARRAAVEPEIRAKEAALAREQAKLTRLNADLADMQAELDQARREAEDDAAVTPER